MTPEELDVYGNKIQNMQNALEKYSRQILDTSNDRAKDLRETIRNLAVTSGAVATGTLVLLGINQIPRIPILITIGVVMLLVEVVLAFRYLLLEELVDTDHFVTNSRRSVKPIAEALLLAQDFEENNISKDDFISKFTQKEKEKNEFIKERNTKMANGTFINISKRTNFKKILRIILTASVLLIVLGLLLPYIC